MQRDLRGPERAARASQSGSASQSGVPQTDVGWLHLLAPGAEELGQFGAFVHRPSLPSFRNGDHGPRITRIEPVFLSVSADERMISMTNTLTTALPSLPAAGRSTRTIRLWG
ncbi:MAG: hypothetical protein JWM12_2705 [Ilumatobacteraceae bacterium]|jgi:hypothetical protein|nr:hypothetical protein [Ilumatobacteraceae bacterium]